MTEDQNQLSLLAAPYVKTLFDTFVLPKLSEWNEAWKKKNKVVDHFFDNKFQEYLTRSYNKFSTINTLVFHNQQKLLKDLYVPLEIVGKTPDHPKFLINEFEDDFIPVYKRVLITDTAGMGKSTLSKKMFLSIIENNKGIPVLIELRRLNKDKTILQEIEEQLGALDLLVDQDLLLSLIKRGDFIFLLDGYDEIAIEHREVVTDDIQDFISRAENNLFVITSRPENSLASFGSFKEFSIRPLHREEAFTLLRKYDNSGHISDLLVKKINEVHNKSISEFLTNPLLVSLLYTAFEFKQTIPFKKHIFYRQVFDAFFESHDLTKGDYAREKASKLDIDDFHKILRFLGYLCLIRSKIEFTKDEILALINESKKFCTGVNFQESELLKDLITTVPLFSKDGIYYKWAHKSLQEYFATQFIYLDSKDEQEAILKRLANHSSNDKFQNIFDLYYSIDYKTFRNVIIKDVFEKYVAFFDTNYKYNDTDASGIRKNMEFEADYKILNVPTNQLDSANIPTSVFKYAKNIERFALVMRHEMFAKSDLKVLYRVKPTYNMLLFLGQKNEYGIKPIQMPVLAQYPAIVPVHEEVNVSDKEDLVINQPENFLMITNLMAQYTGSSLVGVDIHEIKAQLKIINTDLNGYSESKLLDF